MPVAVSRNPFDDYLRTQVKYDKEIMRILEAAAKDTQKTISSLRLSNTLGARVRQAQLQAVLAEIRNEQASMWTSVGTVTQAGRKAAAEAAQEALEVISHVAYASLAPAAAEALTDGLKATARAGINSAYARVPRQLSAAVYRNGVVASGKIDDIIRKGLIQGLSAKELANNVYRYISPTTSGGASYASMRLARTEINNAFHEQQIKAADAPGVLGVKWNLSGSHPRPDECNDLAERDSFRMGPGVYPKVNVPSKPHPHCFCYLSYITVDPDEFNAAMLNGKFDAEIRRRAQINADLLKGMEPVKAPAAAVKRVRKARARTGPASGAEIKLPVTTARKRALPTDQRSVVDAVRKAERATGKPTGDFVDLADVRAQLKSMTRAEQDAALRKFATDEMQQAGARIIPVADRASLTERSRKAALHMGEDELTAIQIETKFEMAVRSDLNVPKLSKGRNLTSEFQDELDSITRRNAASGKDFDSWEESSFTKTDNARPWFEDQTLHNLINKQRYGLPGTVTSSQIDALAGDGWPIVHRGFSGGGGVTGHEAVTEFIARADYFTGLGIYGNGIYTSIDARVAEYYAKQATDGKGRVVRMAINPDAKMVEYNKLRDMQQEASTAWRNKNEDFLDRIRFETPPLSHADQMRYNSIQVYWETINDLGRFAAMRGYDVIEVLAEGDGYYTPSGKASKAKQYIILNRSAVVVEA